MNGAWRVRGCVRSGLGRGAGFVGLAWVRAALVERFGIDPYPGTLNLRIEDDASLPVLAGALAREAQELPARDALACAADVLAVRIAGSVPGLIVVPRVAHYPAGQVELVAALDLRRHLGLRDGDSLVLDGAALGEVVAVIFDVDGTLVDSIAGMRLAAARAAALYGFDVPLESVRRALDEGEPLWPMIVPPDVRADRELAATLRRETMRHWPAVLEEAVEVVAGVRSTLERLRAAGLKLAICTGSRGESFRPLERAGLMHHFDPVVTAIDVRRPKPDPEGLLQCLDRLDCPAGTAVYVGDTRQDVAAARAAGLKAVGVLTGAADSASLSAAGADRLAASHRSLPGLLQITP